jgi:hypothetical protein
LGLWVKKWCLGLQLTALLSAEGKNKKEKKKKKKEKQRGREEGVSHA